MTGIPGGSIGQAAVMILTTGDARNKAAAARRTAAAWRDGRLRLDWPLTPPQRPARPTKPELRPPADMPKRRRAGTHATRCALLHALAHIELNAIDLAWDMVARFGAAMPRAFIDDWVGVGDDEARHFLMLDDRLHQMGSGYGALPAHDGLWQAAARTAHDLGARLAIVPMVLEARGLDVTPAMIDRARRQGDEETARLLNIIYHDEITHVAVGTRWFSVLCAETGDDPTRRFHTLVRTYFDGKLKAPFNDDARQIAGLAQEFYAPLI